MGCSTSQSLASLSPSVRTQTGGFTSSLEGTACDRGSVSASLYCRTWLVSRWHNKCQGSDIVSTAHRTFIQLPIQPWLTRVNIQPGSGGVLTFVYSFSVCVCVHMCKCVYPVHGGHRTACANQFSLSVMQVVRLNSGH